MARPRQQAKPKKGYATTNPLDVILNISSKNLNTKEKNLLQVLKQNKTDNTFVNELGSKLQKAYGPQHSLYMLFVRTTQPS